jgi:hypothetical protein
VRIAAPPTELPRSNQRKRILTEFGKRIHFLARADARCSRTSLNGNLSSVEFCLDPPLLVLAKFVPRRLDLGKEGKTLRRTRRGLRRLTIVGDVSSRFAPQRVMDLRPITSCGRLGGRVQSGSRGLAPCLAPEREVRTRSGCTRRVLSSNGRDRSGRGVARRRRCQWVPALGGALRRGRPCGRTAVMSASRVG